MKNNVSFYEFNRAAKDKDQDRVITLLKKAGFEGNLKVFNLGFDSEDTISFVVDGILQGKNCCCAIGYDRNRQNLIIRKVWARHTLK